VPKYVWRIEAWQSEEIKKKLAAKDITVGALANDYGCAPSNISMVINGKAKSAKVCKFLETKLDMKIMGARPRKIK